MNITIVTVKGSPSVLVDLCSRAIKLMPERSHEMENTTCLILAWLYGT
jgi:hypothetical protein